MLAMFLGEGGRPSWRASSASHRDGCGVQNMAQTPSGTNTQTIRDGPDRKRKRTHKCPRKPTGQKRGEQRQSRHDDARSGDGYPPRRHRDHDAAGPWRPSPRPPLFPSATVIVTTTLPAKTVMLPGETATGAMTATAAAADVHGDNRDPEWRVRRKKKEHRLRRSASNLSSPQGGINETSCSPWRKEVLPLHSGRPIGGRREETAHVYSASTLTSARAPARAKCGHGTGAPGRPPRSADVGAALSWAAISGATVLGVPGVSYRHSGSEVHWPAVGPRCRAGG